MHIPTPNTILGPTHKQANRRKLAFLAGVNILLLMEYTGQLMPMWGIIASFVWQVETNLPASLTKVFWSSGWVFVLSTTLEFATIAFPNAIQRKHKYMLLAMLTPGKKYPNFGHYAFSIYINDDDRIDPDLLKKHYGDRWPTTPEEEDKLYLEIQRKHRNTDPIVEDRHRDKLLARDSFVIALLTVIVATAAGIVLIDIGWTWNWYCLGILFIELVFCVIWANKAWRRYGNEVMAAEADRIRNLNEQGGEQDDNTIQSVQVSK